MATKTRSKANTTAAVKGEMNEFRAIPPAKYEFAFNDEGVPKKRLIVFEDNTQASVRQYNDTGTSPNIWSCLKCQKHCKFNGFLFMVPKTHSCKPITYEEALKQQEKIKAKNSIGPAGAVGTRQSRTTTGGAERGGVDVKPNIIKKPLGNLHTSPKREISQTNYEFGVGFSNQPKGRLFVFEGSSRSLIRQYSKDQENRYFCHGCFRVDRKKRYGYVKSNGIFCVPIAHICQPERHKDVMEEQKKIKEKYEDKDTAENQVSSMPSSSSAAPSMSTPSTSTHRKILPAMPTVASITFQVKPVTHVELSNLKEPKRPSYGNHFAPTVIAFDPNLPSHLRQADAMEFEYGFSEKGEMKQRIIVREPDLAPFVYEYYKTGTPVWKCLNCSIGTATKDDDIVTVTRKHDCEPIPLRISKDRQATYHALYKLMTSPNTSSNDSRRQQMSFGSCGDGSGGSVRGVKRMGMSDIGGGSPSKMSRSSFGQSFNPYSNENWDYNGATTSVLSPSNYVNRIQRYQPSNASTTIKLYKPSSFTLENFCQKVGINYSEEAYLFWHGIKITQVSPSSMPDQIHRITTTTNPGFSSISLYLTGSESSALKIREELNKYFIVNHNTMSETLGQNLTSLNNPLVSHTLFQDVATELHFQTLVHLLQCRIGIFSDNKWSRYGNWDELNADIPIFLMEKKNNNYFPILSLKC